jgi:signal transduction histidine kinase
MRRFYFKIALIFSAILVMFGLLVAFITTRASSDMVQEAMQKTNKDLAYILAEEFQPMLKDEFDQGKIEKKLTELSGTNPQFDFYLLGVDGSIKSVIPASRDKIVQHGSIVNTEPLDAFIAGNPLPILSTDPLNPDKKKPFSVAPISIMGSTGCYLYVVLEGDEFSKTSAMLFESYTARGALYMIGFVLIITIAIGLFIFKMLTQRLDTIKETVTDFERGQLNRRIPVKGNDELSELSGSFNNMADTILENMEEIQKTDKLRRELVANVSHDLRSPLASIQGYLETIQLKGDSITKEDYRKYVDTVLKNTTKLNTLIDDLFELSKLDAEHVKPKLENVSMAELVQDLVLQFKPIADRKSITLEAKFPDNPNALITADIHLMNRALSNLIDNAIKHTPAGGHVSILSTRNGKDLMLEVSDTGSGIPEEDIPHIFDRFYQVDKSRQDAQGAGLGLAIAQKIFALHGASISVLSPANSGTTFQVTIPVLSN